MEQVSLSSGSLLRCLIADETLTLFIADGLASEHTAAEIREENGGAEESWNCILTKVLMNLSKTSFGEDKL